MSESTTNPTVKVGDKLAFRVGYGVKAWSIQKVTKISPTGRITCGHYVLDPDLRVRGSDRYSGPFRGEIIAGEIAYQIKVWRARQFIADFNLNRLSDDDAIRLAYIMRGMAASQEAKSCS